MSDSYSLRSTVLVLLILIAALHGSVLYRGDLITPAGMHFAMWPWKAQASEVVASGAILEENPTLSDLLFEVYPWQLFTARSLLAGAIPLWNPYSYTGVPFVGNAQSAVFYPLHWPAWIFPSIHVFTVALLLKILLAGAFMAIFLRGIGIGGAACVAGSVSFALCGFMTSWLGYAHTNAAIFLPLLMHAARGLALHRGIRPFLLFAFATGAQFLGGHPETSVHILGAAFLYFLWNLREAPRRRLSLGLLGGGALMGTAVAAVQLLPFLDYLFRSAALELRRASGPIDPVLPLDALMPLLVPAWYGRPWDFTYQGPAAFQAIAGYAGAGMLLLALVSPGSGAARIRFFQILAGLSAVVVYGPASVHWILRAIPVVGIGSNNRLLLVLSFCIAVMAAHVMAVIAEEEAGSRRRSLLAWLAVMTALLVGLVVFFPPPLSSDSFRAVSVLAGTAALAALALLRRSLRVLYLIGLVALTAADMFGFAHRYNPHASPEDLFPPTGMTEYLRADNTADMARGGRLLTIGWTMRPETQMVYWLSSIEGYDAMELAPYRRLLDRAGVAAIHETGLIPDASRPLLDLMGTRYVLTPPGGVVSGDGLVLAYEGRDGRVFLNDRAQPRFHVVARAVSVAGPEEALERLASGSVDPRREVVLESAASEAEARPVSLTIEANAPGRLAVGVSGQAEGSYLVVSEAWDPGWGALIDGEPAELRRANYSFMAVRLPEGDCNVSLSYRPASYRVGSLISAFALVSALFCGVVSRGRLKQRR